MLVAFALAAPAWAAPAQFTSQRRIGFLTGDQWEPAVAADASGHVFALYPHYGKVPGCAACRIPTMLLVVSADNGKTWQRPHVMLASGSSQFDAQIAVDPVDRRTVYAAWLENKKREVMLAKSVDSGATWSFTIAARSDEELDKPALAVRGQNVYLAFNHEEQVWVTASQDGGLRQLHAGTRQCRQSPRLVAPRFRHRRSRRQRLSRLAPLESRRRAWFSRIFLCPSPPTPAKPGPPSRSTSLPPLPVAKRKSAARPT